jgi:enoyl-CoA hydratase/carnithine racemase
MSHQPCLLSEATDQVLWLTLNRPTARNALNLELTHALQDQLRRFEQDTTLRVAVITGSDPAFCAGLDLKEFSVPDSPRAEVAALIASVPKLRKPIIAAVNGAAMTGGLELALGCDFIIASERAKFGDTHTKIGALAGGGMTSRLPHAIGFRWAKQLSFTSLPIDANIALRIGLANEVTTHEALLPRVRVLAQAMAEQNPELIGVVKQVLDQGADTTLAECLRLERQALAERKARGAMSWQQ